LNAHVRAASGIVWDDEVDVIVVGAGAGGFAAAIGAALAGASVALLEKAGEPGGTFAKSPAGYWIPDNAGMRADGVHEDRDATLRFLARCARPASYDPGSATLGLEPWEFELMGAYFDHAARVIGELEKAGALTPGYLAGSPDYQTRVPENTIRFGRTMVMLSSDGQKNILGSGQTRRFVETLGRLGAALHCGRAVESVVTEAGRVTGVVSRDAARSHALRARRGVVFCTGGFTHDPELRRAFLPSSILAGAASPGCTGDFLRIATALGLPLHCMPYPWLAPIPLELALAGDPTVSNIFVSPGDSMLYLNRYGRRVLNEKGPYNEQSFIFGEWDPERLEYPNLLLFMLFDQRVKDLWAPPADYPRERVARSWAQETLGNYAYEGDHLIAGASLEALAETLAARLSKLAPHTGGLALAPDFVAGARASIARFNELARQGVDLDFHRGETPIEQVFFGERRPGNALPNPLMHPLSDDGPYYAVILSEGTLDTKGGPRADAWGRILGADGAPVPGLYGAGNCVASMFSQGYPGGGATIGPAMVFGYRAGQHAAGATVD
jgi:succinate dehydrogenase/fumarate reductase flavoprotein subunit